MTGFDVKEIVWRSLCPRWSSGPQERTPGYSALLMLPGDLPVFLRLALQVLEHQDRQHLTEVLVIPDRMPSAFRRCWQEVRMTELGVPIRLVPLSGVSGCLSRFLNNPGHIHWLQHLRGIEASKSTHALVHDADLFLLDSSFAKKHFECAAARKLSCYGISPVWDQWYASRGINHLVATWEMLVDVDWFRSFPPWQHRGHEGTLGSERHVFDTTLLPQCLTDPSQIAKSDLSEAAFVHFNYVISSFRWYQAAKSSYIDEHFRLLLIALLEEAFDSGKKGEQSALSLTELTRCLEQSNGRVRYCIDHAENYVEFRSKLMHLLDGDLLHDRQKEVISAGLCPFDHIYA